ncbi:hypothetical protein VP01_1328g5 [Puccinia sorghi]|uniref:Uncharacterized protein n=1 Tax=Puccinia sorghi TaxID=27349 RepID=A0A0L6VP99_9BASI|nr:hypothetical protein VP01_1328g5 [Puccinia sorghi]
MIILGLGLGGPNTHQSLHPGLKEGNTTSVDPRIDAEISIHETAPQKPTKSKAGTRNHGNLRHLAQELPTKKGKGCETTQIAATENQICQLADGIAKLKGGRKEKKKKDYEPQCFTSRTIAIPRATLKNPPPNAHLLIGSGETHNVLSDPFTIPAGSISSSTPSRKTISGFYGSTSKDLLEQ